MQEVMDVIHVQNEGPGLARLTHTRHNTNKILMNNILERQTRCSVLFIKAEMLTSQHE
jgi:hypothetical protein